MTQLQDISEAFGGTIYIVEPNLQNELTFCDAQPCRQCTIALVKVGICKAIYTTSEGRMKQLRIKKKDKAHVEAGSLELAMRFKTKERGDIEVLNDLHIDA